MGSAVQLGFYKFFLRVRNCRFRCSFVTKELVNLVTNVTDFSEMREKKKMSEEFWVING
jgi:hypothetical protein